MKQPTALDTETTTYNTGNFYDKRNKIVCYSYATHERCGAHLITEPSIMALEELLEQTSLVVGFNFKFDLPWIRSLGVDIDSIPIWDVQIAEFIISNQTNRFPSLEGTCQKYGIEGKIDVVKTEYWDKGINTDEIPWEVLGPYAQQDAEATLRCYYAQLAVMTPKQIRLCKLMCMDLKILQEMEQNGIAYDEQLCEKNSKEIDDKIKNIQQKLADVYPSIPINFNSPDHLSAFLYGGTIVEEKKVHDGFYKSRIKAGQPKLKKVEVEHILPKMFEPIRGTALKKEGMYSTNEDTLKKLKGKNKHLVVLLQELAKLETLNSKYFVGIPKLNEKMNWPKGKIHGQFNQCIAATGRLSSKEPNLQNFASELQDIFVSIYE